MFTCSAWLNIQVEQKSVYKVETYISHRSNIIVLVSYVRILHPSPLISILNVCVGTEETIRLESTE